MGTILPPVLKMERKLKCQNKSSSLTCKHKDILPLFAQKENEYCFAGIGFAKCKQITSLQSIEGNGWREQKKQKNNFFLWFLNKLFWEDERPFREVVADRDD